MGPVRRDNLVWGRFSTDPGRSESPSNARQGVDDRESRLWYALLPGVIRSASTDPIDLSSGDFGQTLIGVGPRNRERELGLDRRETG